MGEIIPSNFDTMITAAWRVSFGCVNPSARSLYWTHSHPCAGSCRSRAAVWPGHDGGIGAPRLQNRSRHSLSLAAQDGARLFAQLGVEERGVAGAASIASQRQDAKLWRERESKSTNFTMSSMKNIRGVFRRLKRWRERAECEAWRFRDHPDHSVRSLSHCIVSETTLAASERLGTLS
jgi:hypothetical protein